MRLLIHYSFHSSFVNTCPIVYVVKFFVKLFIFNLEIVKMIMQTKSVIIVLLGISFVLNIHVSYSLPNGAQLEKSGQQLDRNEKREDLEKETIYQMGKYLKNLSKSTSSINERLDNLKTEMSRQIGECSKNVDTSENDLYRRPHNSEINFYRWANSLNRTIDDLSSKINHQISEYKEKITYSENNLNKALDNLRKKIIQSEDSINHTIGYLKMQYADQIDEYENTIARLENKLNRRLENLESEIKQRESSEALRRLPDEIVRDIKSGQFSEAEQKLHRTNNGTYKYAVHEVYDNQIGNFDLILRFADSIRDLESKVKIYEALHNEMKNNNHLDTSKLIKFCESIQTHVLNNRTDFINEQSMYNASWNLFRDHIPNIIADSIHKNEHVLEVNLGNNFACFQCVLDIWEQVLKKLWNKKSMVDIYAEAQKYQEGLDAKIAFDLAVFQELEDRNAIYTHNAVTLGRHMKSTMDNLDYQSINSEMKSKYEELKNKLPKSVKNLIFSSSVCIKNTEYDEYLRVDPDETSDDEKRHVYTEKSEDGHHSPAFKWDIDFFDSHEIHLQSHPLGEYLFTDEGKCVSDDMAKRCVFTRKSSNPDSSSEWRVEVDGDYIQMINNKHKEYMHADAFKIDHLGRRSVYTFHRGNKTPDSRWQIVDCSS